MTDTVLYWIGYAVAASVGLCAIGFLADFWWKRVANSTRIAIVALLRRTKVMRLRAWMRQHEASCGTVQKDLTEQGDRCAIYRNVYLAQLHDNGIFPAHPPDGMTRDEAHAMEQEAVKWHGTDANPCRPGCLCEGCEDDRRSEKYAKKAWRENPATVEPPEEPAS